MKFIPLAISREYFFLLLFVIKSDRIRQLDNVRMAMRLLNFIAKIHHTNKKKSECLRFKSLWIRRFNRHTHTPQIHATIQLDSIKYESESGRWLKLQWWYGCIGRSFCCVCQCSNLNVNVKESESEWNKEDYINRITRKCFTENFREKIIKKGQQK